MSFKPNTPFCLPDHSVLSLQGPDAIAFAQAQFMNDVHALAHGDWQWNGWLSAKGRVQALFVLLRAEPDWLLAVVRGGGDAKALAAQWQRFVFRSQLSIQVVNTVTVTGVFGDTAAIAGALACWPWGDDPEPRALCLFDHPVAPDAEAQRHWRLADIAHGVPWLESSQIDAWTPQMLSLDRLDAYSVKKGCYPGQEIVARTHFLGQAKRGLVRLGSTGTMSAGDEVSSDGRALGKVVCAERSDEGWQALAVLPSDRPETLVVGNHDARQLPLLQPYC